MRAVIVSHLFGTGSLVSEWLELYKVAFVWGWRVHEFEEHTYKSCGRRLVWAPWVDEHFGIALGKFLWQNSNVTLVVYTETSLLSKMTGFKIDLGDRFDKPFRSVKYKCSNAFMVLCNGALDFNLSTERPGRET